MTLALTALNAAAAARWCGCALPAGYVYMPGSFLLPLAAALGASDRDQGQVVHSPEEQEFTALQMQQRQQLANDGQDLLSLLLPRRKART